MVLGWCRGAIASGLKLAKAARRAAAGCKVAGCKAARCKAAGSKLRTARLQAKTLSSMNRYTSRVPAFAANETIISSEKQGATRPTDRLTERQTTRLTQTDRQAEKQTDKQTDKQTQINVMSMVVWQWSAATPVEDAWARQRLSTNTILLGRQSFLPPAG